jgi:hypothetical protein
VRLPGGHNPDKGDARLPLRLERGARADGGRQLGTCGGGKLAAVQLFLVWYFILGFLLGNGVPHFTFGAAGKVFRSPFGQRSSPRTNVLWGLSNFVTATIIVAGLIALNLYSSYSLVALMLGFWLMMLMFGTGIKRFLNEGEKGPASG